jgi:hypothetical protein
MDALHAKARRRSGGRIGDVWVGLYVGGGHQNHMVMASWITSKLRGGRVCTGRANGTGCSFCRFSPDARPTGPISISRHNLCFAPHVNEWNLCVRGWLAGYSAA